MSSVPHDAPPPRPSSSADVLNTFDTSKITKAAVGGDSVSVHFTVNCTRVREWEFVFVCGSHKKLGEWCVEKAVEMVKDSRKDCTEWRASIQIKADECRTLLRFRYFIGYYLQSGLGAKKALIVSKWESQHRSRCILPSVEALDGICRARHVEEFGHYGGKIAITDGWLNHVDQQTILLRLHGEALQFYKARHSERPYFLKVTPFDVRHREVGSNDEDFDESSQDGTSYLPLLPSFSSTEIANLFCDDSTFDEQPAFGQLFRNNEDFFVFKTNSLSVENLAFRIELFTNPKAKHIESRVHSSTDSSTTENSSSNGFITAQNGDARDVLERFAIVYCMPASIPNTFGSVLLPILNKSQQPVGQLKVDYMFVNALPSPQSLETTFARHWKKRRIPVEVGHRGMGNSYTKFSAVRENTVDSMNHAAKNGADFVEFDVQLSKDKISVIFHDFHVLVSVARRDSQHLTPATTPSTPIREFTVGKGSTFRPVTILTNKIDNEMNDGSLNSQSSTPSKKNSDEFHELAVKDLWLRQLRLLHMHHRTAIDDLHRDKLQVTPTDPHELPTRRPFPTLVEALTQVDLDIGFNIEIKYPMNLVDGSTECENYFERNEYVDVILKDVLEHGGSRRIVFSSFEPDICAMVALKQIKYPVLFLCIGRTVRYVPYKDERSSSSRVAVNFAICFNLLGVNFHSEDLLVESSQVARAHENGLVSFVWGEDLENHENIDFFRKKVLVDGIIYDGIGEREARQNIFVVEREAKHALFNGRHSGQSPSPSRTSSFDTLKDAMLLGTAVGTGDASTTLKKAIKNIQRQQQDLATENLTRLVLPK